MVTAIVAMVVWIIVAHHLWERPSDREQRGWAALYNGVTVLTISAAVLSAYAILFALILLSAWVFVPGAYFQTTLKLGGGGIPSPPLPVRALLGLRIVRNLPARIIGFGIWPVHVRP